MKNNILSEVYRFQELMGVQKKLLKENKIIDALSDLMKDFIAKSERPIANVLDKVTVGEITVEKQVLKNIIDVLDTPSLYGALNDSEKIILARLISQSSEIVDDVYKTIFTEITKISDVTEKELISKISQEMIGPPQKQITEVLLDMQVGDDVFVPTLLRNKINGKVKQFEKGDFVEEIKSPAKLNKKIKRKINAVDVNKIKAAENLDYINKFFASHMSVTNIARRFFTSRALKWEEKLIEQDEFIKSVFSDILRTTNKITGDGKNIDSDELLTELRRISQKMRVIQDTNVGSDIDSLYLSLEEALMKTNDVAAKAKIPEVIKKMKEVDPYKTGASLSDKSYAWKFLQGTATQQTINNCLRLIRDMVTFRKTAFTELKQLTSRIPMFLTTGAPKTWTDFQNYFSDYGPRKGLLLLTRDLWVATHVGLPITLAAADTIYNFILLCLPESFGGKPKGTIKQDYYDNIAEDFGEQYKWHGSEEATVLSIAFGILNPVHPYGFDIGRSLLNWTTKVESNKGRMVLPVAVENLLKSYGIGKDKLDSIINDPTEEGAKQKLEQIINEQFIKEGDTEIGFKLFCLIKDSESKPVRYKSFDVESGFAYTQDGQRWGYDDNSKTFIPKPE